MNQYAKKANATGSIYLEDINSLKAKYDELIQLYGKVLHQFNEIAEALEQHIYVRSQFKKTVRNGLGKFPTRGICITDALLANLVFEDYEAGA